jgi:hypothetical protein
LLTSNAAATSKSNKKFIRQAAGPTAVAGVFSETYIFDLFPNIDILSIQSSKYLYFKLMTIPY